MELPGIIEFIARQQGINIVDFLDDVILVDEGYGIEIREWKLPVTKPTAQELLDAEVLAEEEKALTAYVLLRKDAYPDIEEQLDMLYWDKINGTSTFEDAIRIVKETYPKE